MIRNPPILFMRVGKTKTGRALYRLCHPGNKPFGRAFCLTVDRLFAAERKERKRAR